MNRRHPQMPSLRVAAVVVVVAVLALSAQSPPGQAELTRLGLGGPPARYTELAIRGSLEPPPTVSNRPSVMLLPFTITNNEDRAMTYRWRVSASPGATARGGRGVVSLGDEHEAILESAVTVTCAAPRAQITLQLDTGERLSVWATCVHLPRTRLADG